MWDKIAKPDQIIIFSVYVIHIPSSLSLWLCVKSVWYCWSSFTDTECPVVRNIKPQNNLSVRLFTVYWTRLVLVLYTNAKRSLQHMRHTYCKKCTCTSNNNITFYTQIFWVGGEVRVDQHIKTNKGTNQTSCSQTGATVLPVAAFNQIYKSILLVLFVVSAILQWWLCLCAIAFSQVSYVCGCYSWMLKVTSLCFSYPGNQKECF